MSRELQEGPPILTDVAARRHLEGDSTSNRAVTFTAPVAAPYSIFTRQEKWTLVAMVAVAGFYSPLPANIYFPAIPALAKAFHKSTEAMNQTVTVYLVLQGMSPMLWGPLSDRYGRRIVFLICLTLLLGSCIGLALCPTDAFWLLLFLRCLQSGGGASTIALGAGVIGDISTPKERGGYFGTFNLGPMLAPCIGPVVGGALSQGLGWRSIFWFLVAMAGLCLVSIFLFLPETLRALVGNGSLPVLGLRKPLIPLIGRKAQIQSVQLEKPCTPRKTSINPFIILTYPDIVVLLSFTGIVYAINYTITASISSSFAAVYPYLSETAIGLCYLSTGGGMLVGSTVTGKLLDWEYLRVRNRVNNTEDFPFEYVRLRTMPLHLVIFSACVFAWGWTLASGVSIAVPLALQFILGWVSIAILNTTMTLNIDILQSRSSAATACTNFIRCSLAAILVSVIDRMTATMGMGWAYFLLGIISTLQLPFMIFAMKQGPIWRKKRDTKYV